MLKKQLEEVDFEKELRCGLHTLLSGHTFDITAYEKIVEGYHFIESVMLQRDLAAATNQVISDKVNTALIRHATLQSCRWMTEVGISPQNHANLKLE